MACNTNSLSCKVVINVCDARKLGHICNYEIDLCSGRITAIFVPSDSGLLSFTRRGDIRIPWECIRKVGEDAILVELPHRPVDCADPPPKKQKFR